MTDARPEGSPALARMRNDRAWESAPAAPGARGRGGERRPRGSQLRTLKLRLRWRQRRGAETRQGRKAVQERHRKLGAPALPVKWGRF